MFEFLGFKKDDKYLKEVNLDTFKSKEFYQFKKQQEKLYSKNKILIITKILMMVTKQIKYEWIYHLRSENIKKFYQKEIIKKIKSANLYSKEGKYSLSCLIAGDNDLSVSIIRKEQMDFCKKDYDFKGLDVLNIDVPIEYLTKDYEDYIFEREGYVSISINKSSSENDLIQNMDPLERFVCNGESSLFESVIEMIEFCNVHNIEINDFFIGWEY